jgi:hypothetical protein
MEITKEQAIKLKEFIRSRKLDIKLEMENFGLLKPILDDKRFNK